MTNIKWGNTQFGTWENESFKDVDGVIEYTYKSYRRLSPNIGIVLVLLNPKYNSFDWQFIERISSLTRQPEKVRIIPSHDSLKWYIIVNGSDILKRFLKQENFPDFSQEQLEDAQSFVDKILNRINNCGGGYLL